MIITAKDRHAHVQDRPLKFSRLLYGNVGSFIPGNGLTLLLLEHLLEMEDV